MAAMVHVASDPCQSNPVQPKSPSAASSRSVAWRAPVLALARGEVESRLARVRGLVPAGEAEGPEQAADYLVDGRRLAVDVRVSDENGQHVYKSSLLDDELSRERPGVASKPEAHARRRRFGFSGGSGNLVELKVEATGSELSSRWPRYRFSQLHVHILYRESPSDDYWDPGADTNDDDDVFELSKIQHDILEMFIKSVRIVKAATALSSFSLGSVPSRPRRCLHPYKKEPGPGVELVDAAAEVLVGLCTTAVCALNGSCSAERPRRATAQPRPRRTLEWAVEDLKAGARPSTGAGEAAKVVPKRSLTWGGAGAPGVQRACSPRGKSRRKVADGPGRGLASGGLDVADAEAPTELDPTPWDGPTTSDDSLHLWRAVANQDVRQVEAELRKIEEQSRERGDRNWLSRVLEHRRKFRHTSNPKPLTGTVLLFALQELEQAVSADVSGDIAADICTRLVERGADAEATYKVERCGKEQAELVAPLCFAARSTRALELLREFKVAFGKASRINYFRHGSLLWQAVWINDEDMVRFLLQADRADQRLRGGKHLYEVAYVDSREVALPRVLQCSSIKDAKHNRTDRAGGDASCFQIYCESKSEREKVWRIEYSEMCKSSGKCKAVRLMCPVETKSRKPPAPYADYCVVYNWHIRDRKRYRKCFYSAEECCKVHKKMPDQIFERVKRWKSDPYHQPPYSGWVRDGEDSSGCDGRHYTVQSTHMVKGWHPDYPPPSRENYGRRCSALGLALYHHMDCVSELMHYGFRIDESELNAAIALGSPAEFEEVFHTIAKTNPEMLLRMPRRTILLSHPELLESIWSALKDDPDVKDRLQRAVQTIMQGCVEDHSGEQCDAASALHMRVQDPTDPERAAKRMVFDLVRNAPQAAAILLDNFFRQKPEVASANRNPLATHALINPRTNVNTAYVANSIWTFDQASFQSSLWQRRLTGFQHVAASDVWGELMDASSCDVAPRRSWMERWNPWTPPQRNQFSDITVVHFRGILTLDLFRSLCDLQYTQQVDLLEDCVTMQAVVSHAWTKWARNYNCTLLAEEVVQFVSVLVWGLSEGKGDLLHSASWMLFSFIALGRLMHDACIFGLNVAYLLFLDPSDRALTSSGDVFNWPAVPGHVLSCYLFGTGWTLAVIDDVLDKEAYLFWLGVALVWKWCAIISRLHTTSVIGQLLIPIRDVFWEPLILAMLVVLILTVLVVMAFVFIVWKEGSASQIRGAAMNTWINLVIGEPVLLMGEVPNEFDYPWSQYVMISIVHLAITIVLMNVLMAMTMEAYRGMGVKARGRLLRTQAVVCRVTMWKRRVLLTVFCNWLGLNANKALFAIFSFLVVSTAAVLLVTEVRMMIILLMYGGAAEMLLTLFVLLLQTPVKPANATPELKWWIEQNYLWMCTPRREDPRSDSGHAEAPGSARLAGETTPRLEASDDDDDAEIDGDASPRRLLSAQFASTRAESALSYRRNLRGRASDSALEVDTSSQILVALKMLHDRVEELSRRPGPSQGPGEIV